MRIVYLIIFCLSVLAPSAQNMALNHTNGNEPFVCSYKCNNSFNNLKKTCIPISVSLLRQEPIKNYNVNPYDEFNLIIAALRRDRGNPFPLLYSFRDCESVCNAASVMVDSIKYIFYNQNFLNNIKSTNDKLKWIVRSIIAHEIGHHILDHTLIGGSSIYPEQRRKQELRADYFSAFVIRQFPGATLDDALSGLNSFDVNTYYPKSPDEEDGSDYPTLENRKIAINEGFNDNDNSSLRIAMFRNIDSVALVSYNRSGKSIILHEIDKAISFGNFREVKEKIDLLNKQDLKTEEKNALLKLQLLVNEKLNRQDNSSVVIDKPSVIAEEDIKNLKELYEKYKKGKTEFDKKKAESLLKSIKALESKLERSG